MHHTIVTSLAAGFILALSAGAPAARAQAPAPPAPAPAQAPVVPAPPAALERAALEKKIDELLAAYAKVNGFSGTVLLASQGKPLFTKGIGYANVEWQIPNTAQTKFRIGSVTKQFTSMLVMQLREQGKVKVEDSVCVYVTPCPEAWKPVTIHHLLTHTSGIPTYTGIAAWRETNMVPKTVDQMVAIFRDLPLQWIPGERYAYNNSGYFLLGVVIEKAAGKKYEQALQDMILTPLGMTDTGYDWSKTIIPRRASGYSGRGAALTNAAALDMQQPYSAGSLYSTVEDLLKWDQALYTEKLLPEAAKQVMWTPFKDNYAYGWSISQPAAAVFGGHRRIAHTGGINGFSSVIVRLPDTNVTLIVLGNNDSAGAAPVARDVAAIYYGQPYTVPAERTVGKVDPAVFDRYLGKYELGPGFVITVTREGNSLMSQATGQGKFEIANAFLVPEATMAQRISRAKQNIKSSGVPFGMPTNAERAERLSAVLHILYLIFNEGYASSIGPDLQRTDLSNEALRLTRGVHRLLPDDPEVAGLLALMLLTDARRRARTGPEGELIPLDEQDRSLWDRKAIAEGIALISETLAKGAVGPYQLQAAIAAVHDEAARASETDWPQIVALYSVLKRMSDNPMVALNHAIAVAMVNGPRAGLELLDRLDPGGRLAGHYRMDAVRGHLCEMAGDHDAAITHYRRAAERTTSIPEKNYLAIKAARLSSF